MKKKNMWYKPKYFHQIKCNQCGNTKLQAGINLNKELRIATIDFDCLDCNEPVLGIKVDKEDVKFVVGVELEIEKREL